MSRHTALYSRVSPRVHKFRLIEIDKVKRWERREGDSGDTMENEYTVGRPSGAPNENSPLDKKAGGNDGWIW